MADRRSARTSHVRPRPPSSGRQSPPTGRTRAPSPARLATHGPIRRDPGVPWFVRLLLLLGVIAVAAGVVYVGVGGLGTLAAGLGSTVGGFVDDLTATPMPTRAPLAVPAPPSIVSPSEPYTNHPTVDLVVTVDRDIAGDPDHVLAVYLTLEGQQPAQIDEVPLSATPQTVIPVTLTDGVNDFSVVVAGPGGRSEPSPVVRYVLDTNPPGIFVESPKDGATVNRAAVDIEGRSQGRTALVARNEDTGDSIGVAADANGRFTLALPLRPGRNRITIDATDPAGNTNAIEFRIDRGDGALRASLSASAYRIKRSNLPAEIRLTATVDDPDGRPLPGAEVTFTLSMPGIPTVTGEGTTDEDGRATFVTTVPAGADKGGGSAAVLVRAGELGQTSDQTVVAIE
jgi:hypothetical protein